jgi:hypothetical protein
MLAEVFSHGLIRDYVVAFGTLFNNIKINRRATSGEDADTIAIPLSYAPQQRYIERLNQDPNLDRPVAISLPRMSFEMVSMNYAPDRKLNTMQRYYGRRQDTANTQLASTYSPVPYDFNFQLSVYISNIEDGTHIIEQILPYFTPEFTVSLKSVTELGLNMDLPMILNSVNMEDSYEGGFDERRIIIWTLDFTMKGQLFGPVSNSGLINKIKINLRPTMNAAVANNYEQIYITPGQFANGLATNKAALSVDPLLISANSDYGISEQLFNVGESADVFKIWEFNEGQHSQLVSFGPAIGNTSYGGWETFETETTAANGEVTLLPTGSSLRHTIKKTASDSAGDNYSQNAQIQIYANTVPDYLFEPFYGKNYQNISMRFKIKDRVDSSGGNFTWRGNFYWLTSDSAEKDIWNDSGGVRHVDTVQPSDYTISSSSFNTLSEEWQTINWDMKGANKDQWNERIITALRFELFLAADPNGPMTIDTDIDYIKISANTQ